MGVWHRQESVDKMFQLEHSVIQDPSHSLTLPLTADAGNE